MGSIVVCCALATRHENSAENRISVLNNLFIIEVFLIRHQRNPPRSICFDNAKAEINWLVQYVLVVNVEGVRAAIHVLAFVLLAVNIDGFEVAVVNPYERCVTF